MQMGVICQNGAMEYVEVSSQIAQGCEAQQE
jgi:hypothetical protein